MADKKNDDVKYVKNEFGGVHSVTADFYEENLLLTLASGKQVLRPGWEDVSAATARKENPQLFGEHDPNVIMNSKELQDLKLRREIEAEFSGDAADAKSE